MSEKNVEIVRRATEAYSRGDLDEALASWSADAVLDWSNSRGLEAAVVRGRDEIRAYMEQFLEAFEEVRIELEDVFEADEGVVIVENRLLPRTRRHRSNGSKRLGNHPPEWLPDLADALPIESRCPQSHRPVGVDDVGGERGAGSSLA